MTTGTQAQDINEFYVSITHTGKVGREFRYAGNSGTGTWQSLFIQKYVSDQTGATVLTAGTMNWIAIGR